MKRTRPRSVTPLLLLLTSIVVLLAPWAAFASADEEEFALKDGDTVVFLGDSITAARTYGRIVERYTRLRYPQRSVRFFNAGQGGDTAAGGLARFERDVLSKEPTVVIAAYGINDIGWGSLADEGHKKTYLEAIRGLVKRCNEANIRLYVASAAVTAADPDQSESDFLQGMCDEGMAIAREQGAQAIDLQRTMRSIQKKIKAANSQAKQAKDRTTLHASDGIHLNDLGQLAMAFAVLKGLGAPADVSSAKIKNDDTPSVVESNGCAISNLQHGEDHKGLEFDRLDEGLPLNFGVFGALQFRFIPIPDELNRYQLMVEGLKAGRYLVEAEGRGVGTYSADQLAKGVNLASATADPWQPGGPWDAQSTLLLELNEARDRVQQAQRQSDRYLPKDPRHDEIESQTKVISDQLDALQQRVSQPVSYHFVIRPAAESKPEQGAKP